MMSTMDTHLLSHAQYFIGMKQSTFSMLIASMVAARHDVSHDRSRSMERDHHGHVEKESNHTSSKEPFLWSLDETCMTRREFNNLPQDVLEYCHITTDHIPSKENFMECKKHPYKFDLKSHGCVSAK